MYILEEKNRKHKACMCVRGERCERGHVSIITEINSFPLFPLHPWVSAHTAAALSIWNSAKDTCGSTMCTLYLCTTLKVSTRAQRRDSAACENSVGVWQWFTELPAEPPTVRRSREERVEGDDYWLWLMVLVVKWPVVMWRTQPIWAHYVRTINTNVIWENRSLMHACQSWAAALWWQFYRFRKFCWLLNDFCLESSLKFYILHKCMAGLTF